MSPFWRAFLDTYSHPLHAVAIYGLALFGVVMSSGWFAVAYALAAVAAAVLAVLLYRARRQKGVHNG